ncbi:MAG: hypothetical protein RL219_2313 [Actinomycetota bacterium]
MRGRRYRFATVAIVERTGGNTSPSPHRIVERRTEYRILGGLMGTSALGGLGQLIGLTGTALLIEELLGSKTFIGTGNFAMMAGTALGASLLTRRLGKNRRRPTLIGGYLIGAIGGVVIGLAARWQWYPLVLVGLAMFGFGNTASQQSRFAAADVVPDARRGRAMSIVVWASTIGVVFGPKLWGPSGRLMAHFGIPELGGAYIVGGGVYVLAAVTCWLVIRPDPREISRAVRAEASVLPKVDVRACLRRPSLQLALLTLVIGQIVMVAVMSVTSVHLHDHGYSADAIGTVISGHVLGMYAPSPVSGWLIDRIGRIPVLVGGCVVLIAGSMLSALSQPGNHALMIVALFVLGVGWNANFVAGSTLVTDSALPEERPRIQAISDSATFLASGSASLLAGFALQWSSYSAMGVSSACIAALCGVLTLAYGPALRRTAT